MCSREWKCFFERVCAQIELSATKYKNQRPTRWVVCFLTWILSTKTMLSTTKENNLTFFSFSPLLAPAKEDPNLTSQTLTRCHRIRFRMLVFHIEKHKRSETNTIRSISRWGRQKIRKKKQENYILKKNNAWENEKKNIRKSLAVWIPQRNEQT